MLLCGCLGFYGVVYWDNFACGQNVEVFIGLFLGDELVGVVAFHYFGAVAHLFGRIVFILGEGEVICSERMAENVLYPFYAAGAAEGRQALSEVFF